MTTLHIYLDESGNFDFSPTGSRYYVFAATWTYTPYPLSTQLTQLRSQLLKEGHNLQTFHASEDKQENRNKVINIMVSEARWKYVAMVIEKAKVHPSIRKAEEFYPKFAAMPLRFIFRGVVRSGISQIMIYTDTIPFNKHREAVEKAIRTACRRDIPNNIRFSLNNHDEISNEWLQVVDYCSWAIFRKWERDDTRTYDQIRARLEKTELDVMERGDIIYYSHPTAPSN